MSKSGGLFSGLTTSPTGLFATRGHTAAGLDSVDPIGMLFSTISSGASAIMMSATPAAKPAAPGLSSNFNTRAIHQAAGLMKAPAPVALRAREAMVKGNPQAIEQRATQNVTTARQAMKDIDAAAQSQKMAAGGGKSPSLLGMVGGEMLITPLLAAGANMVVPGAGMAVAVGSGAGTLATALSKSDSRPRAPSREKGRPSRTAAREMPAAQPPLDIMSGHGYTNMATPQFLKSMSQGPGFGKATLDEGKIHLAGESLAGMKIGGQSAAQFAKALEKMEKTSTVALNAKLHRDQAGLADTPENIDRALRRHAPVLDARFA